LKAVEFTDSSASGLGFSDFGSWDILDRNGVVPCALAEIFDLHGDWGMRSQNLVRGTLGLLGVGSAAVCGCVNPMNTRLPTVATPPPPVEKRSYDIHDPFPDEDLGPDTMTRPRGFSE